MFLVKWKGKVGTSLAVQWLRLCFYLKEGSFNPWSGNWEFPILCHVSNIKNDFLKDR